MVSKAAMAMAMILFVAQCEATARNSRITVRTPRHTLIKHRKDFFFEGKKS